MTDYKYKVTVGMPVYGVENYIHKSLLSVLNQTYKNEFEIITVDDRGPDNSMNIVRELQNSHPRGKSIRILTQPQNMGCWAARNRILEEAQGEYLLLLDSDAGHNREIPSRSGIRLCRACPRSRTTDQFD